MQNQICQKRGDILDIILERKEALMGVSIIEKLRALEQSSAPV